MDANLRLALIDEVYEATSPGCPLARRIDALAATHGLALKIVATMAEVPSW